jgi:hypothetical protein
MREYLITLLPVVWALVATLIAMILYRTSSGLFEQRVQKQTVTRRVRMTGSIFIAALAFVGLAKSTPPNVMTIESRDLVKVPVSEVRMLRDRVHYLENQLVELEGCAAIKGPQNCAEQMEGMRTATRNVASTIKRLQLQEERIAK